MNTPLKFRRSAVVALTICTQSFTYAMHPYPVVDTSQSTNYDNLKPIAEPGSTDRFYGQDANYEGIAPSYRDNGDGTVTDLNTGLTWSQYTPESKYTLAEAKKLASSSSLAGYDDWRIPTIKELYSLIDFRGVTGMPDGRFDAGHPSNAVPYIDTDYFGFRYGNTNEGERFIDAQWLSSTENVSPVMHELRGNFGVNFADGRIKCYPAEDPHRGKKKFYVRLVRGRTNYGENQFVDNRDGTISDRATELIWTKFDSGRGMNWEDALRYAESTELAGHSDWRLPNAKELQSIIDYSRSPSHTNSPAIDPLFEISQIINEAGEYDYPYLWTSTTHVDGPNARQAVYFSLGSAIGQMHGRTMDVHGAGAQRSDPKNGQARLGHGPQGDAQRVLNYVICVRGNTDIENQSPSKPSTANYPALVQLATETYRPEEMDYFESMGHNHNPSQPDHDSLYVLLNLLRGVPSLPHLN